ncbi:MAG: dihydroorotate dehydrogenase (quinone), partial [Alphaproteobacteria bacterium]|nr:dihydroorotate dehydrogenase (quinone) [Alphaproteobacteria bacterium]
YRTSGKTHGVLGINLAKNKETEKAADDYVKGVETFAGQADFLTVNVSSPNTPGLRDAQERDTLAELLARVTAARAASGHRPLLFLKIAPDITDAQAADIAEVALASGIDGMIVGNTTVSRPSSIPADIAKEAGGLSGRPLFDLSTKILGQMYKLTEGKLPLIGCGGISNGADAYAKIRAGAGLLQIYSALVYHGPFVVSRIANELAALLRRDGFAHMSDAVGADVKL